MARAVLVIAVVLVTLASGCSSASPEASPAPAPAATEPSETSADPITGDGDGDGAASAAIATAAPANQPEIMEPVRFVDSQLRSPVGIAANRGWLFLSAQRRDLANSDSTDCLGTSRLAVMDSLGTRQTVDVPGDEINRVEIGPGDWGYVAVSCARKAWVVPLRVNDGLIGVVTGTATGAPQIYEADLPRFVFSYSPLASVWRSDTTITVMDQGGGEAGLLDLMTGERTSPPPAGLDAQLPAGQANLVLERGADPQRVYYVAPDMSCHGGPRDVVATPRIVTQAGDSAVTSDPGVAFRGLTQMAFGPQDQVSWLNTCNWVDSIWTADVDPSTGEFDSITEVMGAEWLLDNAWTSAGVSFGLRAVTFDEQGSVVAWAHTNQGLETATSTHNDAGRHSFAAPLVAVAVDPGPPEPVAAPQVLDTAQSTDIQISELASGRAAGTADRAGLVFYGLGSYRAQAGVEGCDGATSPVFGFGATTIPQQVAVVPGTWLGTFQVDWQGRLVAISTCGNTVYVSVGEFDVVSKTISADTLRVWKLHDPQTHPELLVSGDIRWGPHLFDQESGTWHVVRTSSETLFERGWSDSGRYRYFATPGFFGDESGPIDPTLRLMVEDTSTGEIRPAADSPVGVTAHRLIFGPNDEVAWISGNELGSGAALGRMDWSTGEIVEVKGLMPDLEPYWGYPLSGSGRPGPDAIAFEPDGTLRAWAYTFGPGESRSSDNWIVDTLTFSLED